MSAGGGGKEKEAPVTCLKDLVEAPLDLYIDAWMWKEAENSLDRGAP